MKKIFSALLAAVLAAGTMVLPTAAADGDIVYLQTFDNVASYDDLGWEIVETLTTNTSTYTIENGALTVDNLGGNDSYTVVVPASVMDEVNQGDYTVGYDFTLLESGDTARYLAMLLNYDREVGNTYNSLHMRMKGYADWQNRFVGTWSANMDTNGGYQGLPLFTAKDDGAISNRLFGLAYTDAENVIAGKTIRYEMRVSNSGGYAEVYMNGVLISGTDEAGWDQFTWASEDYSEICLKSGGSILGTVDNIVVVKGLGIPEGTIPAMEGGASASGLPATEYDSIANYAGIKPVIDGKIDAIWDATAAQESTWPGDRDGEGISGYTKILWDEDNLYFLGVVNDPTTLQEANPTTTDSIDFWVSETYSDEMGYPLEGDYQLALSPYNTYGGNKAPDLVNETGAVINGDGTYVVEFSIPWQTQGLTPAAGHVFGYNASFNNDLEGDGARDSWTSWVEWTNMPYWSDTMWLGHVELVKADVAVAVDEEAPAADAPAADAPAAEAPAADEPALQNLCAGAVVTEVSGLETEGANTGDMAIDGDLATRWSSNTDDNAHIIIDIGQPLPIGYVEIHWETACAQDYTIETSSDGTSWDVRATVTGNTKGTSPASADCIAVHEWTPATARFIKINCTKRNTEWGNSIWEVVARKAADTVESTAPAAYPASGTAVPEGSVLINGERIGLEEGWGGNAAAGRDAAFDGDVNTFFDPLGTGDGWCGIDAGEEMILTKIVIHPRDAWADRFNGGTIEGANEEDFSDAVALFLSVEAAGEVTFLDVSDEIEEADNTGYRYFRYINYTTHGDVAEVELYGKAVDGTNPTYGAAEEVVEEPAPAPAVEETPAEEVPAEEPAAEEVVEAPVEEPAEEVVEETVEEVVEEEAPVEEAPQTFDFGVIAAAAAVLSLAGFAVSKKR